MVDDQYTPRDSLQQLRGRSRSNNEQPDSVQNQFLLIYGSELSATHAWTSPLRLTSHKIVSSYPGHRGMQHMTCPLIPLMLGRVHPFVEEAEKREAKPWPANT